MCNINIIYNTKGKKSQKITECMNVVSYNSFQSNKDAEGHYCEDFKVKTSVEKQIFKGSHSFIVAHERFSTSGKVAEMSQPLESEHFVLTHNGVFSSLGGTKHSDTWEYLKLVEEEYEKVKDTKQAVNIVNKRTAGYYSCVIFNKDTKEHLYYKHNANMYILRQDDYFLMSTKQENVEYMRRFFALSDDILEVKEHMFFDVSNNMEAVDNCEFYEYVAPLSTYQTELPRTQSNYYRQSSTMDRRNEVIEALECLGIYNATVGVYSEKFLVGVHDEGDKVTIESAFGQAVLDVKHNRKYLISLDAVEAVREARLLGAYYNAC